jgi:hypothetical protein
MANNYLVNKLIFDDPSGAANFYSSGHAIYYMDEAIWPTGLYGINTNELIIISIDLASGCTEQQIIFPNNYHAIPKVVYSIYGQEQIDILGSQIASITSGSMKIRFTYPIPNDKYSIQLFMFRNDTYKTISGTTYDFNAIQNLDTLFVDSYYGYDAGGFPDRPGFPYQTISGAITGAWENTAFNIYVGKGSHGAIPTFTAGHTNTNIVFAPQAKFVEPILVPSNTTLNLYDVTIDLSEHPYSSGISLGTNSVVNFYGTNFIKLNSSGNKNSIVGSSATANVYGSLHYDRPVQKTVKFVDVSNHNSGTYNIVIDQGCDFVPVGNQVSGTNRTLVFSGLQGAIDNSSGILSVNVKSGAHAGFSLSKDSFIFEFDRGALITSPIMIAGGATTSFVNLQMSHLSNSGINVVDGSSLTMFGENSISVATGMPSITGLGTVSFIGRTAYTGPLGSGVKAIDHNKDYDAVVNSSFGTGISGINATMFSSLAQSVVGAVSSNSKVFIGKGYHKNISINAQKNLTLSFDDGAIVSGKISVTGGCDSVIFKNMRYDSLNDTSISSAVDIYDGSTGIFREDCVVRLPYVYAPYYITGTLPNTGEVRLIGATELHYDGYPFTDFITGSGISGYYFREGGIRNVNFSTSVSGDGISGYYASSSGSFAGSVAFHIPNSIVVYNSGVGRYINLNGVTGDNITGAWYSGMCYYFEDSITGTTDYIIGYVLPTGAPIVMTDILWERGKNSLDSAQPRTGYYWSGLAGYFSGYLETGTAGVSGCNITGFYMTGVGGLTGYFELSYGPAPFVIGYYYSGGLSGAYISGAGGLTGVYSSGTYYNQRYAVSGSGAAILQGILHNQIVSPNIVNLIGNYNNLNSGALFNPFGIAQL